jgi:cytochrome c-type biogenesis protein CcmE
MVKIGSIEIKKGTLENKFIITDFKNDMVVLYKGRAKSIFQGVLEFGFGI